MRYRVTYLRYRVILSLPITNKVTVQHFNITV